jgi:hypothetical protein
VNAIAQLIPPGFQESIDGLTLAIKDLKSVLNATSQSTKELSEYVKKFYDFGEEKGPGLKNELESGVDSLESLASLGGSVNGMSDSLAKFYTLAEAKAPGIEISLSSSADALQSIAAFGKTVEDNTGKIVAACVGTLAFGIVLGTLLSNHIFVMDKERNVLFKTAKAGRVLYQKWRAPIRVEALDMPAAL